jgi:hypothetical protein
LTDLERLNAELAQLGAKWRAADHRISRLSAVELRCLLGWKDVRPEINPMSVNLLSGQWSPNDSFDSAVDWRNRNGRNYVSPIRNQEMCGTCTPFAVAAQVESMALIEQNAELDISEADLGFCGSRPADCSSAWNQSDALNDLKSRGAVQESKFRYHSAFPGGNTGLRPPSCTVIPNHDKHAVKVSNSQNIHDVQQRKSYLTHVGPMTCGIIPYTSFFDYGIGIYHPILTSTTEKRFPGHTVLVIGYSEADQCWIIKNSWGPDWGEGGFGRIAYGTCEIDTAGTYFSGCDGIQIPDAARSSLVTSTGLATLGSISNTVCCDGFYTDDDDYRHVIVGASDGQIVEVYFGLARAPVVAPLAKTPGLIDLGAFYTSDDGYRHVVTLNGTGDLEEIYYSPKTGISRTKVTTVSGATAVCGFFSPDDGDRHAVVLTVAGQLIDVSFGTKGLKQTQIDSFTSAVAICGFYSGDDDFRHVIVASANGVISETFFHPTKGVHSAIVGNVSNPRKVAGFWSASDKLFSRRVLVLSQAPTVGAGQPSAKLEEIRYSSTYGSAINVIRESADSVDIGGFQSSDDGMAHGVFVSNMGSIYEAFY